MHDSITINYISIKLLHVVNTNKHLPFTILNTSVLANANFVPPPFKFMAAITMLSINLYVNQ